MEKYNHKVAAVFESEAEAEAARLNLLSQGYTAEQVSVVSPSWQEADKKIEPEGDEVGKTVVKDAVIGGAVGGAAGAVGTGLLAAVGVPLMVSPIIATVFMVGWGISVGAFAGAGVGVNMNEDQFAGFIKDAAKDKHWVLVVQTRDDDQTKAAIEDIKGLGQRADDIASV